MNRLNHVNYFKPLFLLALCINLLVASGTVLAERTAQSGYDFIKPETQAMQDDEVENPGSIAVDEGQVLFNKTSANGQSCAACHGAQGEKLSAKSLARYPVYDKETDQLVRLQDKISQCRQEKNGEMPLPANSHELIALETFVRHLAVGEPVNVQTDGRMEPLLQKGEALYKVRYGLIDMSCAHCHDAYTGQMIRGQKISQGQANGFPAYRLDTGQMANLDQRIQQCMKLMRAEPFAADSDEIKQLGAYIMARSNGLPIETPAVRY